MAQYAKRSFTPTPPDKGSFPLDHDGVCKSVMSNYMSCLYSNKNDNSVCREEIKAYLDCRMKHNLMSKEEWSKLGLADVSSGSSAVQNGGTKMESSSRRRRVLVCCTGSVASIKMQELVQDLVKHTMEVKVVATEHSLHFFKPEDLPASVQVFRDADEWTSWSKRGDDVLHISLSKWAEVLLIAPLGANTLAKISQGLCDNLLTCVVRAWGVKKPLIFCPAMNTQMWEHPITASHITKLHEWGYIEVPCISKTLVCGDTGLGAMAEVKTIVNVLLDVVSN